MTYNDPDPYSVLGVSPGASLDEIKKAYRKLVQKWHPDVCGKTMANIKRFLAIKDAYTLLKDRYLKSNPIKLNKPVYSSIPVKKGQGAPEGAFCFVQIPIEKALTGTKISLEISDGEDFCPTCGGLGSVAKGAKKPCPKCNGRGYRILPWGTRELRVICQRCSGKGYKDIEPCTRCKGRGFIKLIRKVEITIPPGTKNGDILKFPGEGPFDPEKHIRTPLFVEVEVTIPDNWIIHGKDIIATVTIDCWTHLGGGYVTINTIDGPEKIFIKPGQNREGFIRIKQRGWIDKSGKRGDMLLRLKILPPFGPCPSKAMALINELKRLWPCVDALSNALPAPSSSKEKDLLLDK